MYCVNLHSPQKSKSRKLFSRASTTSPNPPGRAPRSSIFLNSSAVGVYIILFDYTLEAGMRESLQIYFRFHVRHNRNASYFTRKSALK